MLSDWHLLPTARLQFSKLTARLRSSAHLISRHTVYPLPCSPFNSPSSLDPYLPASSSPLCCICLGISPNVQHTACDSPTKRPLIAAY
jgi:hypothetical protein